MTPSRACLLTAGLLSACALACASGGSAASIARVAPAPDPRAVPDRISDEGVKAALARALVFLKHDGDDWMAGRNPLQHGHGCVSCHHVGLALWSQHEAARAGLPVSDQSLAALEAGARAFMTREPGEARAVSTAELLLGRDVSQPAALWQAAARGLGPLQTVHGSWEASGQFPAQRRPIAESDAVATSLSLLAIDSLAGSPATAPGHTAQARALTWLRASRGTTSEWIATRLLVEQRLGTTAAADGFRAGLKAAQRPDGGWSWLPGEPSNAYSTGQSLYALRGRACDHGQVRRAVAYLLATQRPDGTWDVPSRLFSKTTSDARDYIYRYWGTAWSAIGLAASLASCDDEVGGQER